MSKTRSVKRRAKTASAARQYKYRLRDRGTPFGPWYRSVEKALGRMSNFNVNDPGFVRGAAHPRYDLIQKQVG